VLAIQLKVSYGGQNRRWSRGWAFVGWPSNLNLYDDYRTEGWLPEEGTRRMARSNGTWDAIQFIVVWGFVWGLNREERMAFVGWPSI
jgi:hypothetical protein